jgi:hypothetical protein
MITSGIARMSIYTWLAQCLLVLYVCDVVGDLGFRRRATNRSASELLQRHATAQVTWNRNLRTLWSLYIAVSRRITPCHADDLCLTHAPRLAETE